MNQESVVIWRSVGGQRGVMGDHREVVEGQWEAIATAIYIYE